MRVTSNSAVLEVTGLDVRFRRKFQSFVSFEVSMPTFLFVANDPSLDLVNTEVILAGVRTDLLQSFADLTQWFGLANLAPAAEMQRLASVWADTPEARAALQATHGLRSVLRNAVERVAAVGRTPSDLAGVLGKELQHPRLATEVTQFQGRLRTRLRWILEKPRDLLIPVAHYAANFFATAHYPAVRKCENPKCILWFYDSSKNHTRRWCSMELCGNRAKAAAFRERI
jgi:predicted RNA-binding Zn ribbon-like protein